jgi:hypothetical protein
MVSQYDSIIVTKLNKTAENWLINYKKQENQGEAQSHQSLAPVGHQSHPSLDC